MTYREKVMATTLVTLMGVMGAAGVFYLFVYEPIGDVRGQLDAAREQLVQKQGELKAEEARNGKILDLNPKLALWQELSVPPNDPDAKNVRGVSPAALKQQHLLDMQVEYELYLSDLMKASGFKRESVKITSRQPDRRAASAVKGKLPPLYDRLAFNVTAKGTAGNVAKMARDFYQTNLLHQIRTVNLKVPQQNSGKNAADDGLLDVNLTVEALMVTGAKDRKTLLPSKLPYQPKVLAPKDRNYLAMDKNNMFTGYEPYRPPVERPAVVERKEEEPRVTESKKDVLRFVKLTSLFWNPDRRRWEGSFYDQARGPRTAVDEDEEGTKRVTVIWEQKVNVRTLRELTIYDKYNNKMLDAEVVYVDEKEMIIKTVEDKKFYRLRCGDTLYPAIETPLDEKEVRAYGF